MKYVFLKNEAISFCCNKVTYFKPGDEIEDTQIYKVSPTLLQFYLKEGYLKPKEEVMLTKSLNPVIENKAITNYQNKSFNDYSVQELKTYLKEKNIKFHHFFKKDKLLKLIEENK